MAGHHDIGRMDFYVAELAGGKRHAAGQPGPRLNQHVAYSGARVRQLLVDDERGWRGVIEQKHDLGEQAVAGAQIDDAPASKEPPHFPRNLPGFKKLFARQAARMTDGARNAMKQRLVRKAIEVATGQSRPG